MIVTGGAAHNQFVEADCMKRLAVEQGVPSDSVVEEKQAQDTIQNIWFSKAIMDAHGWRSAEVVSSPSHLPRTALILEHYKGANAFAWRTHAALWPREFTREQIVQHYAGEMKGCWRLTHQWVSEESVAAGELRDKLIQRTCLAGAACSVGGKWIETGVTLRNTRCTRVSDWIIEIYDETSGAASLPRNVSALAS